MLDVELSINDFIKKIWDDNEISYDEENSLRQYYNEISAENDLNLLDFESICRKIKFNVFLEQLSDIFHIKKETNNDFNIVYNTVNIGHIEISLNRYYIYMELTDEIFNDNRFDQLIDHYTKDQYNARIDLDRIHNLNILLDIFKLRSNDLQINDDKNDTAKIPDPIEKYKQLIYKIWEDNNLTAEEIMSVRIAPKNLGIESKKAFSIYLQTLYNIISQKICALSDKIKISRSYDKAQKIGIITFSFFNKQFFIIKISITQLEFIQKLPFNIDSSKIHSNAVKLKETGPFVWYKINGLVVKDLETLINNTSSTLEFLGLH